MLFNCMSVWLMFQRWPGSMMYVYLTMRLRSRPSLMVHTHLNQGDLNINVIMRVLSQRSQTSGLWPIFIAKCWPIQIWTSVPLFGLDWVKPLCGVADGLPGTSVSHFVQESASPPLFLWRAAAQRPNEEKYLTLLSLTFYIFLIRAQKRWLKSEDFEMRDSLNMHIDTQMSKYHLSSIGQHWQDC